MKDFLVIGGGSQAKLIINIINQSYQYEITQAEHHLDITDEITQGIVAIGDIKYRQKAVSHILSLMPDFKFKYITHPYATIESAKIGLGTMIIANAFINIGSEIGQHCLINTGCIVEHDNKIGDFCNLQPGVIMGGCVEIGSGTMIGMGAIIRDHIKIGSNCIIGMGSVVLKDLPDYSTVWGNPAKEVGTMDAVNCRNERQKTGAN